MLILLLPFIVAIIVAVAAVILGAFGHFRLAWALVGVAIVLGIGAFVFINGLGPDDVP